MNPTKKLCRQLESLAPLAIAFSGGVDSLTLATFCRQNSIEFSAYTFCGAFLTEFEMDQVSRWARTNQVEHKFIPCNPLEEERIAANTEKRCYYCKKKLFNALREAADPRTSLVDGTNSSDLNKFRPGHRALLELGINSPLASAGFDRDSVEQLAGDMHLELPGFSRSCLLTRFDYGYPLRADIIRNLGSVEDYLLRAGITGFRIRFFRNGRICMQLDPSESSSFQKVRSAFDYLMQDMAFYPYQVRLMDFREITGYFDQDQGGQRNRSDSNCSSLN